jgi:hypothetical protein
MIEILTHCSHEFMHRVENSFRALHERIEYLERRHAEQGPSDEQVERVVRKIFAECFADGRFPRLDNPGELKDGDSSAKRQNFAFSIPSIISIDPASLQVDPDAVPSKAYGQSFQMLEKGLQEFPRVDVAKPASNEGPSVDRNSDEYKHSTHSTHQSEAKPW